MEAKIVVIGNSSGVRLSRETLRQCSLDRGSQVTVTVKGRSIVITPRAPEAPRAGWEEQFRRARSKAVKENLWGDLPLSEVWDR